MKTAEEWDKFFCERYNHKNSPEWKQKSNFEMLSDMVDHIQLDAFKAGAEWAANEVRLQQFQSDFPIENGDRMYFKVMDNISNLKELPK